MHSLRLGKNCDLTLSLSRRICAPEAIHDQLDARLRLFQVRISIADVALRNTVGAEKKVHRVRLGEPRQFSSNGLYKGVDVCRMIGPRADPLDIEVLECRTL